MTDWKVVYVSSRAEKKISERLNKSGILNYVPLKKEIKQWSDRKKIVVSPMINGYVFVRPENNQQRDAVLQQQGVIQYLRYNGTDALVREEEIEVLRSIEKKGYHVEGSFVNLPLIGEQTTIQHGPFKGLKGKVQSQNNEEVYTILIESISYNLILRTPKDTLSKDIK